MAKSRLTAKQQRFVDEYLIDLNATQAAIRAGYSEKTADRIGPELLGKTCVSDAIQEAQKKRQKRTEITQDYVLEKLKEITDQQASDAQDSRLKYTNKIKALELLGKHLGMFDKQDGTASDGGVQIIDDV
ncbi:terminase small subunit [[Clostridium] leptum]|nr:terminase small subunit [[Clostridium] leptum]